MPYTVRKLDRRFKLHRAGFNVMLVWPECRISTAQPGDWQEFHMLQRKLEAHYGTPYFQHANPEGQWHCEYRYRDDVHIVPRVYLKTLKQLTLVQLL